MKTTFKQILKQEGLGDWKIKVIHSGGGLCLLEKKEIWLDAKNYNLPYLLHEIAHALTSEWNEVMNDKTGHHSIWGDKYTQLCVKYLKPIIPIVEMVEN